MRHRSPKVLAFVMAGGEGTRLYPLTLDRCKPSIPFNGKHRIVDFVLSNLINSEIFSVYLLVQYKSQALIEHVRQSWTMARFIPNQFVTVVPPQMRTGTGWFQGTADAVAQNVHLIETQKPDLVAVFGADHIYRMDVRQMIDEHVMRDADVSIATLPVPIHQSSSFGVVVADDQLWVRAFAEKPAAPDSMPGRQGHVLASMGNYLFSTEVLLAALRRAEGTGMTDFGKHILPELIAEHRVLAYDFTKNEIDGVADFEEPHYWRDVGTIEAFFDAQMDTLGLHPKFCMRNTKWPIYSSADAFDSAQIEAGMITRSVIGSGCIVDHACIDHTILRRSVRLEADAVLDHCIVMERSIVHAGAKLKYTIVDTDNEIPPGEVIGGDRERDAKRFHVSERGLVVVPRGYFPRADS